MYVHHWSSYIVDRQEQHWYRHWVRVFNEFSRDPHPTKNKLFRLFERFIKDVYIVAKNSKSTGKRTSSFTSDIRWVNLPITDDDTTQVIEWLDTQFGDFAGYACNVAERGFALSLKPGKNDDFMCTIFGDIASGDVRESIGVSAYASNAGDAFGVCLYKFIVLLNWGANVPPADDKNARRFR